MSRTGGAKPVSVKRESYFSRFRQRWKRRGVIEIDESHTKYPFTLYIRQGLRESQSTSNNIKENFDQSDYLDIASKTMISPYDNQKFDFVTYAPTIFESLRDRLGLDAESYISCISPDENEMNYLEFVSNSKSGQNFFLSNNKQLMIKTHTASEKKFFLKILPSYIEHFQRFPHSLLVKFLGIHKLTIGHDQPIYFVVMQNILFPEERIGQRYDLKACEAGRFTEVPEEEGNFISVMKDVNFGNQKIVLGCQREWFLRQIEHDTEFLRKIGVIDYSLMIGIQKMHRDEIQQKNELASIFMRTKKSTSRQHSVLRKWANSPRKKLSSQLSQESQASQSISVQSVEEIQLPGTVQEETTTSDLEEKEKIDEKSSLLSSSKERVTSCDPGRERIQSLTESESIEQNRRLLPESRNELHVIDGSEEERYFVGIIDFFTPYKFKKKCESAFKAIKYGPSGISYSTVNPNTYAHRFLNFLKDHVV